MWPSNIASAAPLWADRPRGEAPIRSLPGRALAWGEQRLPGRNESAMRVLGRVLHVAQNGYIVATLEDAGKSLPKLNTPVYTEGRRRVGILLDIIGPVAKPYAVVKPDRSGLKLEKGLLLYYRVPRPRPRRSPRGRRGSGGRRR